MPTRGTPSPAPQPPHLSFDQMERGAERLGRLIGDIEAFDPNTITKRFGPEVKALEARIKGVLESVFGHDTVLYRRYARAVRIDVGPVRARMGGRGGSIWHDELSEAKQYVNDGKAQAVSLLREAVAWLTDEMQAAGATARSPVSQETAAPSRKVFVVHGHDGAAKHEVARFVGTLGLEAIVLHEQANEGRTIIEKIEAYGDEVGFAIILLTPDDEGAKRGDAPRPRPRQNVVMELGYFIGKLGRKSVCALKAGDEMDLPSDILGVVWERFEPDGQGWKLSLARELKASGYDIDWNKVMG
jgi:predicted nucleotide-binding protein